MEKTPEQNLIFTNGCFDLLHPGHIYLIRKIREIFPEDDNRLIIGLNSDESIFRLKGEGRPFYSHNHRKYMLESIKGVDEVIIFNEDTPLNLIEELVPDFIIKGSDYVGKDVVGSNIADVLFVTLLKGFSTTVILEKIKKGDRYENWIE